MCECVRVYTYMGVGVRALACVCVCVCVSVCMSVCLCLNAGLTAARINLIFGMHIHIGSDCAIVYMILTFEVIKGHYRSSTPTPTPYVGGNGGGSPFLDASTTKHC